MAQSARRVVTEIHDEPHLEGRRITVRRLQGLVEGAGRSLRSVAEEFDLDIADLYAALQYYHTHPEEMADAEKTRRERERTARQSGAKSLAELREERGDESGNVSDSR
jgi:uncharacterized protein (DUF433 family)